MTEIDRGGYSVEDFERQFNPRQAVPDHQPKIDSRVIASAEARCRIEGVYDLLVSVRFLDEPQHVLARVMGVVAVEDASLPD